MENTYDVRIKTPQGEATVTVQAPSAAAAETRTRYVLRALFGYDHLDARYYPVKRF